MIKNTIKLTKIKLNQHRAEGTKSKLDIMEVAHLMDVLKRVEHMKHSHESSVFHMITPN
jgi:hypothetical protein